MPRGSRRGKCGKDLRMSYRSWVAALLLVLGAWAALGQEAPKYDVLKKMYDDAVGSLKAAQDAKNQLATKNEELGKQVGDLQKQVAELQKRLEAVTKDRDELQLAAT